MAKLAGGKIPGDDVSRGEILTDYIGAGPIIGTGVHRYVFLVYKQSEKIKFDETHLGITDIVGRGKFSNRKFATKYNLGNPIAGNMFRAEH